MHDQDLDHKIRNWDDTYGGLGGLKSLFKNHHFRSIGGFKPLVVKTWPLTSEQLGHLCESPRTEGDI